MRRLAVVSVLLTACATSMTPRANTRADVLAYVNHAATVVETGGERAGETIKQPAWMRGEWYVFMLDLHGRTLCHPAHPEQVGVPVHDLVDANGKRVGDEFLTVAKGGGGWVDYSWRRPGGSEAVTSRNGRTFVIGSGGYELP